MTDDGFIEQLVPLQSRLYRYIASLVPSRADAEDLFQRTWLTAWQERQRFEEGRNFFAWVCGVARNHVRHHYRSLARARVVLDAELVDELAQSALDEQDYLEDRQAALTHCLDKLPAKQRDLLQQYYGQEQTVQVFADGLGKTTESVYKMLQRIRAALHDCVHATLAQEGNT